MAKQISPLFFAIITMVAIHTAPVSMVVVSLLVTLVAYVNSIETADDEYMIAGWVCKKIESDIRYIFSKAQ
jgi:hypothetical protein